MKVLELIDLLESMPSEVDVVITYKRKWLYGGEIHNISMIIELDNSTRVHLSG